ncbi:MAG: hypothetical protein HYY17_14920 [Planctomycetes bacterium]|nr:hypothetical protein [Planctomycetota bacterium]
MKWTLAAAATLAAAVLFVLGVRAWRARRRPGWRGEFVLALSAALAMFAGASAGEPARQEDPAAKDLETRVRDVERDSRWKQMRKIFRKLAAQLESKDPVAGDPTAETKELSGKITPLDLREPQKADAPLLSREEALGECLKFLGSVAFHVHRTKGEGRRWTCYDMAMPRSSEHLPAQQALLKKQYEEGKVSKEVYERLTKVFGEVTGMQSLLPFLNARNTALVFRLIRDMAGARAIEIPKISPEVEKKIGDLIEQLGADEIERRDDAHKALIEIGEGAIPQLKKALEHKSAEVRARAKMILEELE